MTGVRDRRHLVSALEEFLNLSGLDAFGDPSDEGDRLIFVGARGNLGIDAGSLIDIFHDFTLVEVDDECAVGLHDGVSDAAGIQRADGFEQVLRLVSTVRCGGAGDVGELSDFVDASFLGGFGE